MASRLFHQRLQEYLGQSLEFRLDRLAAIPEEFKQAIAGQNETTLSLRPEPKRWAAKEIICHLRDIEELVLTRFQLMLVEEEPRVIVVGVQPKEPEKWGVDDQVPFTGNPDRWAEERQYLRNDAGLALGAFQRRRHEVIRFLRRLSPEQWKRGCICPDDRHVTYEGWTAAMLAHDDGHLAQLREALSTAATLQATSHIEARA